jgi:hypothetical protein
MVAGMASLRRTQALAQFTQCELSQVTPDEGGGRLFDGVRSERENS